VAEITIRGVTAALKYPSADSLEDIERDALITKMMNYLQEKKADDLAKAQPDLAMVGALLRKQAELWPMQKEN